MNKRGSTSQNNSPRPRQNRGKKLMWLGIGSIIITLEALLAFLIVALFLHVSSPGKEPLALGLFLSIIGLGIVLLSTGVYLSRKTSSDL